MRPAGVSQGEARTEGAAARVQECGREQSGAGVEQHVGCRGSREGYLLLCFERGTRCVAQAGTLAAHLYLTSSARKPGSLSRIRRCSVISALSAVCGVERGTEGRGGRRWRVGSIFIRLFGTHPASAGERCQPCCPLHAPHLPLHARAPRFPRAPASRWRRAGGGAARRSRAPPRGAAAPAARPASALREEGGAGQGQAGGGLELGTRCCPVRQAPSNERRRMRRSGISAQQRAGQQPEAAGRGVVRLLTAHVLLLGHHVELAGGGLEHRHVQVLRGYTGRGGETGGRSGGRGSRRSGLEPVATRWQPRPAAAQTRAPVAHTALAVCIQCGPLLRPSKHCSSPIPHPRLGTLRSDPPVLALAIFSFSLRLVARLPAREVGLCSAMAPRLPVLHAAAASGAACARLGPVAAAAAAAVGGGGSTRPSAARRPRAMRALPGSRANAAGRAPAQTCRMRL